MKTEKNIVELNGKKYELLKVGTGVSVSREDMLKAKMAGTPNLPVENAKRDVRLAVLRALGDRMAYETTKRGEMTVVMGEILIAQPYNG